MPTGPKGEKRPADGHRRRRVRIATRSARIAAVAIVLSSAAEIIPVSAKQSCAEDLNKLAQRREAALKVLNDIVKVYQNQALPPDVYCPSHADLEATEAPLLVYMIKNRDICKIPDSAINGLRDAMTRTRQFGQRYCQ